uniref:diacylglycerol O-acyltransferase n=1 Tax=Lotharella globosa TaxID=91324 RepID=A0A7S4DP42_9EUKA|eukprot:CAMPEP_0167787424 /NCGR_PEP_ID=MMETSP0111_2-20121227/9413_1 /TAXON_ID=91324 /ORGANISM="Lotharella globosa, Strain CCCM811" /LENGTH=524 /DNA_ID=CAMNT_0007679061 /DNA_START=1 /DNA_END=1575 /DNA_ORIENTATION=-
MTGSVDTNGHGARGGATQDFEALAGPILRSFLNGKKATGDVVHKMDLVGFYLGAEGHRGAEGFRSQLESIYAKAKKSLEIVFVSLDESAEEYQSMTKAMPWWSIPFEAAGERKFTGDSCPLASLARKNRLDLSQPNLLLFNHEGFLISARGASLLLEHGTELLKCLEIQDDRESKNKMTSTSFLGFSLGLNWERRIQSATVLLFCMMVPMVVFFMTWTLILLIIPFTTLPTLVYIIWSTCIDTAPYDGSRTPILRKMPLWNYFRDYFPLELVKTADLDPSKNYMFCYHPHGILSLGAWGTFASDATGFPEKFPGIDRRLLTLNINFKVPVLREWLLSHGICEAGARSIQTILKKGPGSSVVLVVGGAQEALFTQPNHNHLYLTHRYGFVREAIKAGAQLVPCYAFGENDIYDTLFFEEGTWVYWLQVKVKKMLSFSMPIFHGRGLFFKKLPFILPFRRPMKVVVGRPIPVPRVHPEIDLRNSAWGRSIVKQVHGEYLKALRELWDEHKNLSVSGLERKNTLVLD